MPPDLLARLRPALSAAPPGPVGIAVSGGGDSTALLLLLHDWARGEGRSVAAVTVDHGLRPESEAEAEAVARLCAGLGIAHTLLCWHAGGGRGNLQDAAREGRRSLIADWARERGIGVVALGHTLDDQAETVLMRLARGSGVDGLAAIAPVSARDGVTWLRPMLGLRRETLRHWLTAAGVPWAEDPSNADQAFARVRARMALDHLEPLGLTAERLAATAERMALARAALQADERTLAAACLSHGAAGDLLLVRGALATAPREIALRLLATALMWVSGARYRPRIARLEAALDALLAGRLGGGLTLHGCVLRSVRQAVAIRREPSRVAAPVALAAGRWDGRWLLEAGPRSGSLRLGALGEGGLAALPRWRERAAAPRESLLTTPAIWRVDGGLVAAPFVGGGPWRFRRIAAVPPPALAPL